MYYRRYDCRTTVKLVSLVDITNQPLPVPGSRTQHKSLWCWYGTHGEPLRTHKSDPICRSDPQTLDAAGVTAGASAPPRSAFSASVSVAETRRSHRGLQSEPLGSPEQHPHFSCLSGKWGAFLPTSQSPCKQSQENRSPQYPRCLLEVSQEAAPCQTLPDMLGCPPPSLAFLIFWERLYGEGSPNTAACI